MGRQETRDRIVVAADLLFYRQGFERTSFSDIADVVRISRGNFYYHFKTKDEILSAVIERRLADTRKMLEQWESDGGEPDDRIRCFIKILITNWTDIRMYGCPVGTLNAELTKLNHASQPEAKMLFELFRNWLRQQFLTLGHKADADQLAMHLLARSQGTATLASTFRDKKFVKQEVEQMCNWLDSYAVNASNQPY